MRHLSCRVGQMIGALRLWGVCFSKALDETNDSKMCSVSDGAVFEGWKAREGSERSRHSRTVSSRMVVDGIFE